MKFSEESKIFKNEDVLSFEYLPDILPCRETQIKQLADNLLPASKVENHKIHLFMVPQVLVKLLQ